jgi:hypothetical protein
MAPVGTMCLTCMCPSNSAGTPNPCPVQPATSGTPPGAASACLASMMVLNATYTFSFTSDDMLGVLPSNDAVQKGVSTDSNFGSPSAIGASKLLLVTFVYKGLGSTVIQAGGEMQQVINTHRNTVSGSVTFKGASVGAQAPTCNCGGCGGDNNNISPWVWAVVAVAAVIGIVLVFHEVNS